MVLVIVHIRNIAFPYCIKSNIQTHKKHRGTKITIAETLGQNGIFICDRCREDLKIEIGQDSFEKLKKEINDSNETMHKCYLCTQFKHSKDGLKLSSEQMADGIERNMQGQEDMYKRFKKGTLTCDSCFKQIDFKDKIINCPRCKAEINTKKFGKGIKLPMAKKVSLKLYIKFLRGKSTI